MTTAPRRPEARVRLVAAAVESFSTKGFHATTTRDIASRAGMSPAAVYVHHRSKEDLLHHISRGGHETTLRVAQEAVASSDDPRQQLLALVHALVIRHAEAHTEARIVNYELAALSPEHAGQIFKLRRQIEREMRGVVKRGIAAGAFQTTSPHMTALALLSLALDVARWYRDDGDWTPTQIADHYAELALRLVGAD